MANVSVRVQARSFSGPAEGGRFACCVLFFSPCATPNPSPSSSGESIYFRAPSIILQWPGSGLIAFQRCSCSSETESISGGNWDRKWSFDG